jgi:transcriptional regulator with XRE-family HTH domain
MQRKRSYLRKIRQERKLSISRVATDLGIDSSYLARIERGKRSPGWDVGCALGKYFGIEACTLLKRDGEDG